MVVGRCPRGHESAIKIRLIQAIVFVERDAR